MALNGNAEERAARTAAWLGAVVNVLLTVGKGGIGWWTGSRALVADAVHSAADVVSSAAVIIGLRIAAKPPDQDHPYGHGKAEMISSILVGLLLMGAGIDVGVGGVRGLWSPQSQPHVAAAVAALVGIIVKEALFRYSYTLGTRLRSRSLLASAYDHRSDVLSSAAALAGIVLALVGRRVHVWWLLYSDPLAAILVSLLILRMAVEIVRDASRTLMDTALDDQAVEGFTRFVEEVPGVVRVDGLRVRDHGRYLIIDVKIGVRAEISVAEGHEIAAQVKRRTMEAYPNVLDVFVHVNPYFEQEGRGS